MPEHEAVPEQVPVMPDPPVASEIAQPTEGEEQATLFGVQPPYLGEPSIRSFMPPFARTIESTPATPSESQEESGQGEPSKP